jgi:hypothetical protein
MDTFEAELQEVIDELRDAIVQLTATLRANPILKTAAENNFAAAMDNVDRLVYKYNPNKQDSF